MTQPQLFVTGVSTQDKIVGHDWNEWLVGTDGDDVIRALGGVDTLDGGLGHDVLDGGDGDDLIYAIAGQTIIGGEGRDQLQLDLHVPGEGVDLDLRPLDHGHAARLGDDGLIRSVEYGVLALTDQDDVVHSSNGDFDLRGYGGDDRLIGGAGANTLDGGDGADTLRGGGGTDILYALDNELDASPDLLDGGGGDDYFQADSGDTVRGGAGWDTLQLDLYDQTVGFEIDLKAAAKGQIELADGTVLSRVETATIFGGSGDDVISAGPGELYGKGLDGDDVLIGGRANDWLEGWNDNDTISGGAGDDQVWGCAGDDVLSGGGGHDRFEMAVFGVDIGSVDTITDLRDDDIVSLVGTDGDITMDGFQQFHIVSKFTGASSEARLSYDRAGDVTLLEMDVNHDGHADMTLRMLGWHMDFTNWQF
jgi:Ca2+-binding RTX toxin-like protein